MKHLKLFENKSIQSIRNLVEDFNKFLIYVKPIVLEEYLRLAEDRRYIPEQGDTPTKNKFENLALIEVAAMDGYFEFLLQDYDEDGIAYQYFIPIADEDMKDALIKLDAKKYNL